MQGKCQNLDENKQNCPCVETDCERHGVCCECIKYHKKCKDYPACLNSD